MGTVDDQLPLLYLGAMQTLTELFKSLSGNVVRPVKELNGASDEED